MKIWNFLSGWKMVLAWVLTQIPELTGYPGLLSAVKKAILDPNQQNILEAAIQVLMAIGVSHRVAKNIKIKK